MVVYKRKKVTKYRAHTTHGGGHRKKRRGAGSRGGRGKAGTGKRAGQKKAGISTRLGKKGFTTRRVKGKTVNVGHFNQKVLERLLAAGKIKQEGEVYIVDLSQLGYHKLLGTGKTSFKLKISVKEFTSRAEERVKAAGGEIVKLEKKVLPEKESS